MDLAKSQMEKHGWTEGQGLGRSEDGMKEAIKVKMKFDNCGVGHKAGDEFSFHWWDHMFNKALDNIDVENNKDGVKVNKSGDFSITSKKPFSKNIANKELLYGNFVKASTLTQSSENGLMEEVQSNKGSDSSSDEDETKPGMSFNNLTDDDLMRICGGRTAHKAARHGLKLNGKLKRIEEQEAVMSRANSDNDSSSADDQTAQQKKKSKKKRKKEKYGSANMEVDDSFDGIINNNDLSSTEHKKAKKKKKSKKNQIEKIECPSGSDEVNESDGISKKRKRTKKEKNVDNDTNESIPEKACKVEMCVEVAECHATKHKKSKKSKKDKKS